jgi:hypothetical protein
VVERQSSGSILTWTNLLNFIPAMNILNCISSP